MTTEIVVATSFYYLPKTKELLWLLISKCQIRKRMHNTLESATGRTILPTRGTCIERKRAVAQHKY